MTRPPHFKAFEAWARWEDRQRDGLMGGGSNIFTLLAEGKGQLMPTGTGHKLGNYDGLESRISDSVTRLALINLRAANALRVEHGVIRPKGLDHNDNQDTRARVLGVPSLRTYRRLLKLARDFVIDDLKL